MGHVAQIRITNTVSKPDGVVIPRILSIKGSRLRDFLEQEIAQCNKVYTPNRSKEFEYLPILAVWDLADTQEQWIFQTWADLPTKTIFNEKGVPVLIILPEEELDDIGVNKFKYLKKKEKEAVEKHFKEVPAVPFKLKPKHDKD